MNDNSALRACIVGWPVAHSRSPLIHGYWLRTLGIVGAYDLAAVPPGRFAEFAATIGRNGLVGANVTVPHKEEAFAACDKLTANAADVGAVNTLWREEGELWGDNTDVAGFLANLDEQAPDWRRSADAALVVGAGGAARAVVSALLSRGVGTIFIVNRDVARALSRLMARAGLVVNASSLGMAGERPLDLDLASLPVEAIVADLVYAPLETAFLARARSRGLRTVEGLGMLLHQAAPGFERWFGAQPSVTPELRALIETDVRRTSGPRS
jgi:shikimate dehydrogenase